MKPKSSYGFDGISMKLVKSLKYILVDPLTVIINQMFYTDVFPDLIKIAKVIPIYKKENDTIFSNYRPISLLPAISKYFERVIFTQTYDYFQN